MYSDFCTRFCTDPTSNIITRIVRSAAGAAPARPEPGHAAAAAGSSLRCPLACCDLPDTCTPSSAYRINEMNTRNDMDWKYKLSPEQRQQFEKQVRHQPACTSPIVQVVPRSFPHARRSSVTSRFVAVDLGPQGSSISRHWGKQTVTDRSKDLAVR
eukprot:COSAG02_NODE_2325_length_9132_cov_16.589752_8_plen_156_part_00